MGLRGRAPFVRLRGLRLDWMGWDGMGVGLSEDAERQSEYCYFNLVAVLE